MGCFASKEKVLSPADLAKAEQNCRATLQKRQKAHGSNSKHVAVLEAKLALVKILEARGKHREAMSIRQQIQGSLPRQRPGRKPAPKPARKPVRKPAR